MRVGLAVLFVAGAAVAFGFSDAFATESPVATATTPSVNASATVAVSPRHTYTLAECLKFAEQNYPKVQEAAAQLERMRAQLWEAKVAPYSAFQASAGVALAPTVAGTGLYSPNTDVSFTSSMALAWQVAVSGAVPLWTFGKIQSARNAATAQVKVGEHNIRKAKNEVRLSVRQAYYGVQLSRDALVLVNEAIGRLDQYMPRLEERVRSGGGDDIQLLKMRINRAELTARRSEATKQGSIALAGLRFLTGMGSALDVPDEPLRRSRHALGPLPRYLTAARLFRPEINMARAGVLARRAQLDLERARFYPDFALSMWASRSYAPEVADQLSPFIRDDANYIRYGGALALHWKLDLLPQAARVAQAEAQLEEIRATERFALGGVGVEVETAYADVSDAGQRLAAYTDAVRYAKQWLVKVQEGIDVGTFEDEDIVDPAKEYALKRFLQMNATLDYNIALAKLALATGWLAVAPEE